MPSNYTGSAGNVSLAIAAAISEIADGDADAAASFTPAFQKLADYIEALRNNALTALIFEGFESATFPPPTPAGAWAAPSANFGADLAYARDTSNPITGTASANRPGAQTATSNSSMGLTYWLDSPSRITFVFDLLCNASFGDHLDFFIDGVQVGKWSTTTNTTVSAGRFVSDVLREGRHTFDWRYVRGASAAVGSEKARIDGVNIVPEVAWFDYVTRWSFFDDFMWNANISGNAAVFESWQEMHGAANLGTIRTDLQTAGSGLTGNMIQLTSAAVAAGDWEGICAVASATANAPSFQVCAGNFFPFLEALISLPSIAAMFVEFGVSDGVVPGFTNTACWVYDSTVGTDWRFKTIVGGVATTNPSGVNAAAATPTRLSLSGAGGLTNGNGWLGMINGQALPGAGANHMGSTQNLPPATGATPLVPYFRVGSRTAAAAKVMQIDWLKALGFRSAGLIG